MALSTRDLYLVLRARDEASRVLRGLSREMLATGAAARAAAARSNAAALRQQAIIARGTGATAAQVAALRASAAAWDEEARRVERAAAARQRLGSIMQTTSQALITGGVVMAAVGATMLTGAFKAVQFAVEYDRQVRLTLTQVNDLNKSVEEIGAIGLRVAQKVGVAFETLQPALFDIFSSTNANMKEAEQLLLSFSKAAVAGQVGIQDASRATIAIMNAFNIPMEKVNDVLDVQFQLVKYGVGTYAEFSKVFGNVLPSAARAGQSFQLVAAMLAFMTRNGMSAAMASTSAARALEAMSHPKTLQRLQDMGIRVRDAAGNMRPMNEILRDLRTRLDGLPGPEKVAALVELFKGAGGTIQARRFLEQVLLRPGELEELEFYLKQMNDASGAFDEAYATMADSVSVKTELLKNKWNAFKTQIGTLVIPPLLTLMDVVGRVLDFFNNLPPGIKEFIANFMVWGSVAAILGGALLTVLGVIAAIIAAAIAAGSAFLIVVGVFVDLGVILGIIGAMFVAAWRSSETFRVGVGNIITAFQNLWTSIQSTVGPIASTIRETFGTQIMSTLRNLGDLAGYVFNAIAQLIQNYLIPALTYLRMVWQQNQDVIRPLLTALGMIIRIIAILVGVVLGLVAVIGVGVLIAAFHAAIFIFERFIQIVRIIWAVLQIAITYVRHFGTATMEMRSVVSNAIGAVIQTVQRLPDTIRGLFSNAASWLHDAGRNIINGLVNGIKSAVGAVRAALGEVTAMIPDWKGPKARDLKLLLPVGRYIMQGLARGIQEGSGMVKTTLGGLTDDLGRRPGFGTPPPPPTAGQGTTVTQTINIKTQEIDPRVHAAQLGWELTGAF